MLFTSLFSVFAVCLFRSYKHASFNIINYYCHGQSIRLATILFSVGLTRAHCNKLLLLLPSSVSCLHCVTCDYGALDRGREGGRKGEGRGSGEREGGREGGREERETVREEGRDGGRKGERRGREGGGRDQEGKREDREVDKELQK